MNQTQTETSSPRLNPFAFPSDTDFQFVLLIVSVVGASLYIYKFIAMNLWDWESLASIVSQCASDVELPAPSITGTGWETWANARDALNQCLQPLSKVGIQASWWAMVGVGLLLVLAGVIYRLFPLLIIHGERLVPLSTQPGSAEMMDYLLNLCQETGLSHPPVFLLRPPRRVDCVSGRAFGRLDRYYLVLYGGLIKKFQTDRPVFRAVMLHELAHLRNADVDKTYFSVAVGFAFIAFALVPFAVALLFDSSWATIFNASWRILGLTALVYLTLAAVLRVREFYADVRASTWDGPDGALARLLSTLPQPQHTGWQTVLISTLEHLPYFRRNHWQFAFQFHPEPVERYRMLKETHRLFPMDLWEAFGTGVAVTIALDNVDILLKDLLPMVLGKSYSVELSSLITALVFAPLAVGIIGLGLWRTTFASLVREKIPVDAGQLGISLGLGFLVGDFMDLSGSDFVSSDLLRKVGGFEQPDLLISITSIGLNLLWIMLLLVSLYFFFRWMAAGAYVWLEVARVSRSPRPFYLAGLMISSAWLTFWLGLMFSLQSSLSILADFNAMFLHSASVETFFSLLLSSLPLIINALTLNPFTLLALICLWAFPLSAWFWRERVETNSISDWVFLEQSPQSRKLTRQFRLSPYQAFMGGLVGGFFFCVLLLVMRLGLQLIVPDIIRDTDSYKLMFVYIFHFVLSALVQAGLVLLVARRVKYVGEVHGLFAAFVAGCIMTIGALGLNLLFGGTIDSFFVWLTFSQIVNGGAILGLLVMFGVFLRRGLKRG